MQICACFLDGILIYSASLEEHVSQLRQVPQKLREHHLFVRQSKCSFTQKQL